MKVLAEGMSPEFLKSGWSSASMFLTDRMDEKQRSWDTVLASMIHHLCKTYAPLEQIVNDLITPSEVNDSLMSRQTLEAILITCKRQVGIEFSVCFFIDGLDEMDQERTPRHTMVEFMEMLVSKDDTPNCGGNFKICTASRPENEFELSLDGYPTFKIQDYTIKDIESYAAAKLRLGGLGSRMNQNDRSILETIRQYIVEEARGVFLWVILVVQDVSNRYANGEPLMRIKDDINQLFKDSSSQLGKFFLLILHRTPKSTRHQTYALLDTLLKTR